MMGLTVSSRATLMQAESAHQKKGGQGGAVEEGGEGEGKMGRHSLCKKKKKSVQQLLSVSQTLDRDRESGWLKHRHRHTHTRAHTHTHIHTHVRTRTRTLDTSRVWLAE